MTLTSSLGIVCICQLIIVCLPLKCLSDFATTIFLPPYIPLFLGPSKPTHLNMLLIICKPPEPPEDGERPATAEKGKEDEGEEEEDKTLRRRRGV